MRATSAAHTRIVATVPPQIPVLESGDLPFEEDWALLESLGVDHDTGSDGDDQDDRLGAFMFAPGMLD